MKKISLALLTILTASCALFQSEIESVIDILPRDTDLAGWFRASPPSEYTESSIKKYRNDYSGTGLKRLSVCRYKSIDETSPEITVEVVKFNTVLNSYGLFSRTAGYTEFPAESRQEIYKEKIAAAIRGEYAVFVYSEREEPGLNRVIKHLLVTSLKYIGENYSKEKLPGEINILKNRDRYGIIYSMNSAEIESGIERIYFTLWNHSGTDTPVFISRQPGIQDAYSIYSDRIKKGYIVAESGSAHIAFTKETGGTYSFIAVYGRWVYGCRNVPNLESGKKITEELRLRLASFDRNQIYGY